MLTAFYYTDRIKKELDDLLEYGEKKKYDWSEIPAEILETETTWVVKAHVPGINKEDLSVEVEHGKIFIQGERHKPKTNLHSHSQIKYGYVRTIIKLSSSRSILEKDVSAKLKDGILTIVVLKSPDSLPYKVKLD